MMNIPSSSNKRFQGASRYLSFGFFIVCCVLATFPENAHSFTVSTVNRPKVSIASPFRSEEPNSSTVLFLNKKKVDIKKGKDEKDVQEMPSMTTLILAFFNPLRNPNSIFIYMILGINLLAKLKQD